MNLWPQKSKIQQRELNELKRDKLQLVREIKKAHLDWVTAQQHFDFVLEKEQIDYAIYALEAAEKRYEMLIRQAKRMSVTAADVIKEKAKGVSGT